MLGIGAPPGSPRQPVQMPMTLALSCGTSVRTGQLFIQNALVALPPLIPTVSLCVRFVGGPDAVLSGLAGESHANVPHGRLFSALLELCASPIELGYELARVLRAIRRALYGQVVTSFLFGRTQRSHERTGSTRRSRTGVEKTCTLLVFHRLLHVDRIEPFARRCVEVDQPGPLFGRFRKTNPFADD